MMREALAKLDRQANEREVSSTQSELIDFMHIFEHNKPFVSVPRADQLLIVKGFFGRAAGI